MRYTLRQLEVFLAVARTGSVSRAAVELGMSQSATSSSLADVERQFDLQLFDRIGKRLRLSARGDNLRGRAEAVLALGRARRAGHARGGGGGGGGGGGAGAGGGGGGPRAHTKIGGGGPLFPGFMRE